MFSSRFIILAERTELRSNNMLDQNNTIEYVISFSEDIRTANITADDTDGVDCLVLDRE